MFDTNVIITGVLKIGTNQILFGSAAPVAGTFVRGDVMFNTLATAGGLAGWICVLGGTPGTWKTFASITP